MYSRKQIVAMQNNYSAWSIILKLYIIETPGRPMFDISHEQLQQLVNIHFSLPEIAQLLGVSSWTVSRRLSSFGMAIRQRYSHISDGDLDTIIMSVQCEHPNIGYRMMRSFLAIPDVHVQERRIRSSMRRVDPLGVSLRWARSVHRRSYSVPCPNSLWHVDSNHDGNSMFMEELMGTVD